MNKKWYRTRLNNYYKEFYSAYEEEVEYYNDPQPNQWKFDIPSLGLQVLLTCGDDGEITELRRKK